MPMFGIGMQELVLILIVALLVLGPKRLPSVAKSLGRGLAEFRRAMNGIKEDINAPLRDVKESLDAPLDTPSTPDKSKETAEKNGPAGKAD